MAHRRPHPATHTRRRHGPRHRPPRNRPSLSPETQWNSSGSHGDLWNPAARSTRRQIIGYAVIADAIAASKIQVSVAGDILAKHSYGCAALQTGETESDMDGGGFVVPHFPGA